MAETYRVGIVGCGSIAHYHMHGWNGVDQAEVVALADPVAEAREEFGERHGIAQRFEIARADDDCRLCAQAQSRAVRKAHGDQSGRL